LLVGESTASIATPSTIQNLIAEKLDKGGEYRLVISGAVDEHRIDNFGSLLRNSVLAGGTGTVCALACYHNTPIAGHIVQGFFSPLAPVRASTLSQV
jgi:hypothetical protein